MLKLIAALCMILGGAGIGYAGSRELTEREKNLEILLQILFLLKGRYAAEQFTFGGIWGDCGKDWKDHFQKFFWMRHRR